MAVAAPVPAKQQLYDACRRGDVSRVRCLLNDGLRADWINKRDRNRSLLMASAWKDSKEVCRLLIERKAPLDHRDASGLSALHICAKQNSIGVASLLLKAGANVNLLTEDDVTALMICVDLGHKDLAKLLLGHPNIRVDQQSKRGLTALMKSVFENRIQLAYLLIDRGARLDLAATRGGFTALHLCAKLDRRDIARRILDRAAPELVDQPAGPEFRGNAAFTLAALKGHVEMLRLLKDHNADPNLKNSDGCTALDQVKMAGGASPELLQLLKGWSRDRRGNPGPTAKPAPTEVSLSKAIKSNNLARIHGLMLADASLPTAHDKKTGRTPLMLAAWLNKPDSMKLLLEAIRNRRNSTDYVNCRAKDLSRSTALHAAVQSGSEACAHLLLCAGASLAIRDAWGSTPLHLCADLNSTQPLVQLLVDRASVDDLIDANTSADDDRRLCPTKLAAYLGHLGVLCPMLSRLLQLDARRSGEEWLPQICQQAKRARQFEAMNAVLELMPKTQQNSEELTSAKLFKAAMDGETRKVQELLDSSRTLQRSINHLSSQDPGWTALMATAWNDDEATCRLLLERGADPNVAERKMSITALHIAVQQDSRRVAKLLLGQKSIKCDARSSDSRTPLIRAAWLNHRSIAKLLLERSATSVNAQEADGFSALHYCAQENFQELAKLLIRHNADLELLTSSTKNCNTAFTLAAVKGHADMLELLANVGANIYHRSSQGDAMVLAERANRTAAIEALLKLDSQRSRVWKAGAAASLMPSRSSQSKSAALKGRQLAYDAGDSLPSELALFEPNYSSHDSSVVPPIRGFQYSMRFNPRGICVIINNEIFPDETYRRLGSNKDVDRLARLFGDQLKFRTQVYQNLEARDMLALMRLLAACNRHSKFDCFAAFIMSHGEYDRVFGSDGKFVLLDDIFSLFYDCQSLQNKPKLFFVQACRVVKNIDSNIDKATLDDLSEADHCGSTCDASVRRFSKRFSTKMDFLYAYSVTKGDRALRDKEKGSLYIETLCRVIRQNYKKQHLCAMLNMVRQELGSRPIRVGTYEEPFFNLPSETTQLRSEVWFKDFEQQSLS